MAAAAGADLTGASLTYHPESGSLLARLPLVSLPRFAGGAGYPSVLYGLRFHLGNTDYELRATTAEATATDSSLPASFALYRCNPSCTKQASLSGGLGTTGTEVMISVPISVLSAAEGASLTEVQAFTALGEPTAGVLLELDEVILPDAAIPARHVSLGIAPAGTPEGEVVFDADVPVADGFFSAVLDSLGSSSGEQDLWARACLGGKCGSTRVRL